MDGLTVGGAPPSSNRRRKGGAFASQVPDDLGKTVLLHYKYNRSFEMWRPFLLGLARQSSPTDIRVPKRANKDPADFFRAQKRLQLGQARSIRDPLPQLQEHKPPRATIDRDRIGQWLDADSFGGLDVDCPPDMPEELQRTETLLAHNLPEQYNTLDTTRRVRSEIEELLRNTAPGNIALGEDNSRENKPEEEGTLADEVSSILARLQQPEPASIIEDSGFLGIDKRGSGHNEGDNSQSRTLDDTTHILHHTPSPLELSPFELAFAL